MPPDLTRRESLQRLGGAAMTLPIASAAAQPAAQAPEGRGSVRERGARGDGTTPDSAAITRALRDFASVWVPPGSYAIEESIVLPPDRTLEFAPGASFVPARDDLTIFTTGESCYGTRVIGPRITHGGRRGITAFDLRSFRHRAEIHRAEIRGCAIGIRLRELCWDTILYMPMIWETERPIIIENGSNGVEVIHPSLARYGTGIQIMRGTQHAVSSVRILGGYVQEGRIGIRDEGAFGTTVDGVYFERNDDADIDLAGAYRPNLTRTQHFADVGKVAIRARGTDGLTVIDPTMTSGSRSLGLYDIDASNRNALHFTGATAAGLNAPLGRLEGAAALVLETQGAFTPGIVGTRTAGAPRYTRRSGHWHRLGKRAFVTAVLEWTEHGGSGHLALTGLPPGLSAADDGPAPRVEVAPLRITRALQTEAAAFDAAGRLVIPDGATAPLPAGGLRIWAEFTCR